MWIPKFVFRTLYILYYVLSKPIETFDIKNNVLQGLEDFFEESSRRFDLDLVQKIGRFSIFFT